MSSSIQIETSRLLLRPFRADDAETVAVLGREPAKASFLPDWAHNAQSAAGLIDWFDRCWEDPNPRERPAVWAIVLKETGEVIGHAGIGPKEELGGEVELGYAVSQAYAGRGLATEAAKAVAEWAFGHTGLAFLAALVMPENASSARVLTKLGFERCGRRGSPHGGREKEFDYYRLYHDSNPTDEVPEAEPMADFFDRRADGYEEHMRLDPDHDSFYGMAVSALPATAEPITVLDLGCGTGMELKWLFVRAPNARVTCVDLSAGMLELLRQNYADRLGQLAIVQASYVDWQYPEAAFDYALSVNTMHHFLEPRKLGIYRRILGALKPGGAYVEADYMVDSATMAQGLERYHAAMDTLGDAPDGAYHLDIPFTPDVQRRLLLEAGFTSVETVLERIRPEWSGGILAAYKG